METLFSPALALLSRLRALLPLPPSSLPPSCPRSLFLTTPPPNSVLGGFPETALSFDQLGFFARIPLLLPPFQSNKGSGLLLGTCLNSSEGRMEKTVSGLVSLPSSVSVSHFL